MEISIFHSVLLFYCCFFCFIIPKASRKVSKNDYEIFNAYINLANENREIAEPFRLNYSEVRNWGTVLKNFLGENNVNFNSQLEIANRVYEHLRETEKFPDSLLNPSNHDENVQKVTSSSYLRQIIAKKIANRTSFLNDLYFLSSKTRQQENYHSLQRKDFLFFLQQLQIPSPSLIPPYFKDGDSSRIIIYQTRNAFTGGTTAMRVLFNSLSTLGYQAFLCNDTNYNHVYCSNPRGKKIFLIVNLLL
jgi:hypothetical protein